MPTVTDAPLWDHDHPYYCAERNYFNNETTAHYDSWADYEYETKADPELNLLFRWDWLREDAMGFSGEDLRGPVVKETLWLFYVGQRKGLFRSASITVTEADEPAVRAWLAERAKNIADLWQPFLSVAAQ